MPSGKQLSFIRGEQSPSLRFKSTLASYAEGLAKLFNGYVRRAGGVSNRSGFLYIGDGFFQTNIPKKGSDPGVRIFPFDSPTIGKKYLIELTSGAAGSDVIRFRDVDTGALLTPTNPAGLLAHGAVLSNKLISARIEVHENTIMIFYGDTNLTTITHDPTGPSFTYSQDGVIAPETVGTPVAPSGLIITGIAPLSLPVSYLVMQELTDGSQILWGYFTGIGHPHSFANTKFTITVDGSATVRSYLIYRAAGNDAALEAGQYFLVGRIPALAPLTRTFTDYVVTPDATFQPALSNYLYGDQGGVKKGIYYARHIAHYQQRRVVIPHKLFSSLDEGSASVSKLGTAKMMDTSLSPNSIDGFDFTIPITQQETIVATLVMERLILFTDTTVTIIRGGEEGVLTPKTVNPYTATYEGCSAIVQPKAVGRLGFYIDRDHLRLMGIQFGQENSVAIAPISILSDHFLEDQDVMAMEITRGAENIVWLLKNDGTLVSVSLTDDLEITGWASHETDGYIESITAMRRDPDYPLNDGLSKSFDTLYASVIRSGIRRTEVLSQRRDKNPEQFNYADSSTSFGQRLFFINATQDYLNPLLNIEGGTTWGPEETLTVKNIVSADPNHPATAFNAGTLDTRIDFIIDETDTETGKTVTRVYRFTPEVVVSPTELTGHFDGTIPFLLRDVAGSLPPFPTTLQSRWLPAIKTISGLVHLTLRDVSVYADGQVLSSPLNPAIPTILKVSAGGVLTLSEYVNYGIVGLPYATDIETLDLDTSDDRTFTDAQKLVNSVGVAFHESRGGFFGQTGSDADLNNMEDIRARLDELLEERTKNANGHILIPIPAEWENTGRILMKQVDPLPMTILSVYPKGIIGD